MTPMKHTIDAAVMERAAWAVCKEISPGGLISQEKEFKRYPKYYEGIVQTVLDTIAALDSAQVQEVEGWLPITGMPDGKSFLVAEKIMMQDGYFEPEIIYRNCSYYFRADRTKVNVSGLAIYTEIPPPPKTADSKESGK